MKHLISDWLNKHSEQAANYQDGLRLLISVYDRHKWKAKSNRAAKTLKVESVRNFLSLQYFLKKHENDFDDGNLDNVDTFNTVGAARGERKREKAFEEVTVIPERQTEVQTEVSGPALSVEEVVMELKSRRSEFNARRVALFNRLSRECFALSDDERLKLRVDILSLRDLVKGCTKKLDYLWEHGELPAEKELSPLELRKLAPTEINDLATLEKLIRNARSRRSRSKSAGNLEKVKMLNDLLLKYIQQRDLLSK